ncbi:MAG: RNA polymerase factor sigma-54 [Bdellovibrionales bacterium]|nr:RNA polymerase factor sigma-54 [Bdellovibrionales bacterium]
MALEAKLVQKLSQNLLMTPQLQQAIKLLQLGRMEYKEALEKELLENPILEESQSDEEGYNASQSENGSSSSVGQEDANQASTSEQNVENLEKVDRDQNPVAWEDYLESFQDSRGAASPKGTVDYEDRPSLEATLTKSETLREHLLEQLRFADISEADKSIAMTILGNLDKNGYLRASYEEISRDCGCQTQDVERVIQVFRNMDPVGVGARDLGECLLIQLENQGLGEGLAARIISQHMDKLEKRKYDQIAKLEQVAIDQVYQAITAIRSLEPRPGRQFAEDTVRYIVPDIYVYKVGGEYVISLNEDGLPKLRVSPYYLDLLKNKEAENMPNYEYLSGRLKAASWLIKSIHQRQQTIYRVTESIVKFQQEFLDQGIAKLKPLVLKDVADDIGMHESTVSRVTTNKYVHTPQGVFELKFFFSNGIKTGNGDVSSSSVKERIKNMIANEDPKNPISDQAIVEQLTAENVKIARRTVAKYRESMNILSSSKRKKFF